LSDLAYLTVKNDLVWEFIDPTESAYTPEIAKGLHKFGLLAQALNPEWTADAIKTAVEKEALEFAEELVNGGRATWKKDFDLEKVHKAIGGWRAEKNVDRAKKIVGEYKLVDLYTKKMWEYHSPEMSKVKPLELDSNWTQAREKEVGGNAA
jgi:hypothetical protein